jgi:hypothetical protein
MSINPLFLLATATFGWGLSLAVYRSVAARFNWPMGMVQRRHPLAVLLVGIAALVLTFLFIMMDASQRWPIVILGLLFAFFWTGFLRVASQTSLFLAPIAGILLGVLWASTDDGLREIRAIDDKLIERSMKIEQRIEDRLRGMMQKGSALPSGVTEERVSPPVAPPAPAAPAAPVTSATPPVVPKKTTP